MSQLASIGGGSSTGGSVSTMAAKDDLAEVLDREFDHSFYVKDSGVRDESFDPFFSVGSGDRKGVGAGINQAQDEWEKSRMVRSGEIGRAHV